MSKISRTFASVFPRQSPRSLISRRLMQRQIPPGPAFSCTAPTLAPNLAALSVTCTLHNLIAIPVAAGLLVRWRIDLPMSVGAIAMSTSTIIVAFNAQLLRRLRIVHRETKPSH